MRHNVAGRLFGRTANQRKALLRGLVSSLIEHQRIETTLAKAKETRRVAERLVTLGKKGDLHAKRIALARMPNRALVVKLFDEIAPRFADRNGGYLRIIATRKRVNDRSQMAVLEFVDYEELREKESAGKKKDKKAPKAAAPQKKEKKAEAAPEKKEKKAEAASKKKEKKAEAAPEGKEKKAEAAPEKKEKKAKAAPKKKGKKAKAAPKKKGKKAKAASKKKGKK